MLVAKFSKFSHINTSRRTFLLQSAMCWSLSAAGRVRGVSVCVTFPINRNELEHVPDTHVPDTHVPDTHVPDTHVPDTQSLHLGSCGMDMHSVEIGFAFSSSLAIGE